jgi:hypothetical protein
MSALRLVSDVRGPLSCVGVSAARMAHTTEHRKQDFLPSDKRRYLGCLHSDAFDKHGAVPCLTESGIPVTFAGYGYAPSKRPGKSNAESRELEMLIVDPMREATT